MQERGGGGKILRPMKMLVVAIIIIVFLKLLGLGVKFLRWGKNPPGGHKRDGKMYWAQLLIPTIQGLLWTFLHLTLKRRAEISDIFARLLRYFHLSCKNLTIND